MPSDVYRYVITSVRKRAEKRNHKKTKIMQRINSVSKKCNRQLASSMENICNDSFYDLMFLISGKNNRFAKIY